MNCEQKRTKLRVCVTFLSTVFFFCSINFGPYLTIRKSKERSDPCKNINLLYWLNSFLDNDDNDGDNEDTTMTISISSRVDQPQ